jgi:hypothetical protein
MHRTNVYLTSEQERALDARARARGTTRSAVLREIIDRDLSSTQPVPPAAVEVLLDLYARYDQVVGDLFDDDPDLRIDR